MTNDATQLRKERDEFLRALTLIYNEERWNDFVADILNYPREPGLQFVEQHFPEIGAVVRRYGCAAS